MTLKGVIAMVPGLVAVGLTLALPSIIMSNRHEPADRVAIAIEEAKKSGISFDEADVMARFKILPNEDAGPDMAFVFDRIKNVKLDLSGNALSRDQSLETADSLTANSELLSHLNSAMTKRKIDLVYHVDGSITGNLGKLKAVCRVLCAAALGECRRQNWALGTTYLLWVCEMDNWCADQPSMFAGLVKYAIDSYIIGKATALLVETKGDPRAQELALTVASTIPGSPDLRNAFPYETFASIQWYHNPYEFDSFEPFSGERPKWKLKPMPTPAEALLLQVFLDRIIRLGTVQARAVADPKFPGQYDAVIKATREFETANPSPNEDASGFDSGFLMSFKINAYRELAHKACLVALVDIFRHLDKYKEFPKTYTFVKDQTGVSSQMRYKESAGGFVLYWIGGNGLDNGGPSVKSLWGRGKDPNDDQGLTYPVPIKTSGTSVQKK